MRNDGYMLPWCDNCFKKHRISKENYYDISELTDNNDYPLEYVYCFLTGEDIDMKPYYEKIGYSYHGLQNEKHKEYRETATLYEFIDMENSFATLDKHHWAIDIDVIQSNKLDTRDKI